MNKFHRKDSMDVNISHVNKIKLYFYIRIDFQRTCVPYNKSMSFSIDYSSHHFTKFLPRIILKGEDSTMYCLEHDD